MLYTTLETDDVAQLMISFCFGFIVVLFDDNYLDVQPSCGMFYLLSPRFCFFIVLSLDLFVNREYSLTS